MAAMNQKQGKKGRRNDRPRFNKTPLGEDLSSLLPHTSEGVYSNPPLAHTLVALIGCVVEVQLTSGDVYEGVLRAISPNMEIYLSVAHVKGQSPTRDSVYNRKEVKFADVVTISAKTGSNPQLDIFKTDTEISGRTNGPQSRKLQPFTDFSEEDGSLGIMGHSEDSGWSVEEMWAVNQNKFQVSSTYDEELPQYTTPLLRDGENYKQRELEAIQLANEIESKSMYTRHGVDDKGSEEDRWSAVVREAPLLDRSHRRPPGSGPVVTENGSHTITTSQVTPPTQAPPTSTPPLVPPPSTTSPSPLPTPPSSLSELSSTASSETIPPATPPNPTQLPGNNQSGSSDDVITITDNVIDKTDNEEVAPGISSEGDVKLHTSEGELTEKDNTEPVGDPQDELQSPAPQLSGGEREKKEGPTPPPSAGDAKEQAMKVKNFKLDPKAKEFVISASSFLPPPAPLTSASTTPTASSVPTSLHGSPSGTHHTPHTHTRTHQHTPRGNSRYTNHHSPRPRPHTPTSAYPHTVFPSPDTMIPSVAVSSSYMLAAQQPGMASLIRPGLGFPQYAVAPNPMVVAQAANPQILTSPHAQMIAGAGQQQFALGNVAAQQSQLFAQAAQSIITPQGMIAPAGAPAMFLPGMGGVGGMPLSLQQQQQMAAAAVGMPQVAVGQSMVGTTAATGLPRAGYQMQGTGGGI